MPRAEPEAEPEPEPEVTPSAPAAAVEAPPSADRLARRAARRARVEEAPSRRDASPEPVDLPDAAVAGGQVVTIRANRATPPLADRHEGDRERIQGADGANDARRDDEAPSLRPALQATAPRRRRYGQRA